MNQFNNLIELAEAFPTEASCREYFAQKRWGDSPACPHCGNAEKIYVFASRGLYKCAECKKQFTVKVGTVMEGSNLSLRKWFFAIYLLTSHKKGISSLQLSRDLGITQKASWFLCHRIRYAIRTRSMFSKFDGIIELDSTYLGGKEKNKHANKKIAGSQGGANKIAVFGMMKRNGEVRTQVVPNEKMETLHPIIEGNIEEGAKIMTDEAKGFNRLHGMYCHQRVNHGIGEYVNGNVHVNTLEGYWSLVKRMYIGTYHWFSPKHTDAYLDAMEYRYNTRKMGEGERFDGMLAMSECRLKYEDLIA